MNPRWPSYLRECRESQSDELSRTLGPIGAPAETAGCSPDGRPRCSFHARFAPCPSLQTQSRSSRWRLCLRWPLSRSGLDERRMRSGRCAMRRYCSLRMPASSTTSASPVSRSDAYRMPSRHYSGPWRSIPSTPMHISAWELPWRRWATSAARSLRTTAPRSCFRR